MSCWSASLKISKSEVFGLPQLPPILLFLLHICWQLYLVTTHFSAGHSRRQRATLFLQLILPSCLCYILGFITVFSIYPAHNEQNKEGKLLTAIFAPLVGAVLKIISRISVQRLRNVTHPRQSYVLIAPVYFGSTRFTIHGDSWNNSRSLGSLRTEHNGRYRSLLPRYFEKDISSLGKFSHSSL